VKQKHLYASDSVFISVTDDGDGIAPQDQEKLFKLFGKIQKTHHRNKKG
jgi:signal transduction histidine kinase